ncbi:helix-turn-helix transcriptional regulator [Halobacillus sp. Nhm2S1]|uniref:ArsR/SmtB family transcription factor n=1 Tax=Halobacillus sp. Nhm2S1 TaxID=2866716 RepID=UPI001C72CAC8|nr:metalloregulator ArsR/SmtB family transcription factor [Halobacillus sp. Nhm2S1]MBX0357014.1 metalloregulator ArsR/SmtB family transcription factor [Halobacillus sp. Nhm2S1]
MKNYVDIFKVLANEKRLDMLQWLKEPKAHFDKPTAHLSKNISEKGGVCVGDIQEKADMSQSTVSHYLSMMQSAGLLESERHGKWTYYRRNEAVIQEVAEFLKKEL